MADAVVASPSVRPWLRHLPALVVVVFAVVVAALTYDAFLGVHRYLWDNSTHDRNAHYLFALRVVTDIEQFRLGRLLYDLDAQNVWPPLHGTLAGVAMLVGGRDYRVAVLPNLLAWVGTVVFAFLAARRAAPARRRAGRVRRCAIYRRQSRPFSALRHRPHARKPRRLSDARRAVCVSRRRAERWQLAVAGALAGDRAHSTLFLHKYNYWTLCVLTICANGIVKALRPRD